MFQGVRLFHYLSPDHQRKTQAQFFLSSRKNRPSRPRVTRMGSHRCPNNTDFDITKRHATQLVRIFLVRLVIWISSNTGEGIVVRWVILCNGSSLGPSGTTRKVGWGCAAHFPLTLFMTKSCNFFTQFMTWAKIRYPVYDRRALYNCPKNKLGRAFVDGLFAVMMKK